MSNASLRCNINPEDDYSFSSERQKILKIFAFVIAQSNFLLNHLHNKAHNVSKFKIFIIIL